MNSTLIGQKLLAVQPLPPKGLIYYIRYRYAQHKKKQEEAAEPLYKKPRLTYREIDAQWDW